MGANVNYEIKKHGIFPDVVGQVNLNIKTMTSPLKAIDLTKRGKFLGMELIVSCSEGTMLEAYRDLIKV
jgi:RNA 3'-terminal phosphate cyclase